MFNRIRSFLLDGQAEPEQADAHSHDQLQVAAAALLVEAARMDDTIGDEERARVSQLVQWRFKLSDDETRLLVEEAERVTEDSTQLYGFATIVKNAYSHDERVQLVEMLWDIAYADGVLHDMEASLLRRVTGLLYVSDQESGKARKRAMERHGLV